MLVWRVERSRRSSDGAYSVRRSTLRSTAVAAMLAESATELDAARAPRVSRRVPRDMRDIFGSEATKEVAMAKLYATEAAQRIIDRAVQIHGGIGVKRRTCLSVCTARSELCESMKSE